MKIKKFLQVGLLFGILTSLLISSPGLHAAVIAGLTTSGTIYEADTTNFNGTKVSLAALPTGGSNTYIDLTYGNGLLYGLRSDGAVYSSNLSGSTSLVSTTGWSSSITKIDYANGTLFGLQPGSNTIVKDAAGTTRLNISSFTALDFGVRDDGNISLLLSGANAWMFTFANGTVGDSTSRVANGFANFGSGNNSIALDVNGQLAMALRQGPPVQSAYQNGLTGTVTFGSNNVPGVALALSNDNATAFYLASDLTVGSGLVAPSATETTLGTFGAGTGVGIVVVPEPESSGLLTVGLAGLTAAVVFRRRKQNDVF